MMADILSVLGLLLLVVGVWKRSERWGQCAITCGAVLVIAVLLLTWSDVSGSFLRGYWEGYDWARGG